MKYATISVTELAEELRCAVPAVIEVSHKIGVGVSAACDRLIRPQADRVRRHHAESLGRKGLHRPPRRGQLREAKSSCPVFSLDESGARGTAFVTVAEPTMVECVSLKKKYSLEKRGFNDHLAWRALCAVALAATATVEVDSLHGERRLRVSLPTAGGNCVVVLTRHRRTGELVVVTAFHDARHKGHCREEFLALAAILDSFVAPSARLRHL